MHTHDSVFGFLGFGGRDRDRSNAFKKRRRKGQKVRGTLLKRATDKTAWVNIDGHKLLAQIQSNIPEGARLTFIIKQLEPDVILKSVFEPSQAGVSALSLIRSFDTARTLFENTFRPHAAIFTQMASVRRKALFTQLLIEHKELRLAYLDAVTCLKDINNSIPAESGTLSYNPWRIPNGQRHVCLAKNNADLFEALCEFELTGIGMARSVFYSNNDQISFKLMLQHRSKARDLLRYLESRDRNLLPNSIECLEIAQLPQRDHGGIIAQLMFRS